MISVWPTQNSSEEPQVFSVPTELLYREAAGPGKRAVALWGYQCSGKFPRYRWFKTCLETQGEIPTPANYLLASEGGEDPNAPPSAESLVADYLYHLRLHIENKLFPTKRSQRIEAIEYVVGIPSGWSDHSRNRVKQCALNAGMTLGNLATVKEPEAAAAYEFTEGESPPTIGTTCVLCDAGGATVDVISFIFNGLHAEEPFTNIPERNSGNCGGTQINLRFERFLEETLGGLPGWNGRILHGATEFFETEIKPNYQGTIDEQYEIPVPNLGESTALNVFDGTLHLSGADLLPVFVPVVGEVSGLIRRQIYETHRNSNVRALILVGGFSQSPFLYQWICSSVPGFVDVCRPEHAGSAVAKGALVMALDGHRRRLFSA